MANILSTLLSDSKKEKIINAGIISGNVISSSSLIDINEEPELGDLLLYMDLPSNCVLHSLIFRNTIMELVTTNGNNAAIVIGIYAGSNFKLENGKRFQENDPISPNFFGTSVNIFDNNTEVDGVEMRYSRTGANANTGIDRFKQDLWQLAGLSSDPSVMLRIGAKISRGFGEFQSGSTMAQALFTGKN